MANRISPPLARILRCAALALLLAAIAAGSLLGAPTASQAQATTDYDTDNDGLIEISNLAQLDAIRHDVNGNGDATHDNYIAAFPDRDTSAGGRMGCPGGSCVGYELVADLDFDENGDGQITEAGDPTYWNGGAGWTPFGDCNDLNVSFQSTFEGNGHTISNLYINITPPGNGRCAALFTDLVRGGTIRNVGMVNPSVTNTGYGVSGAQTNSRAAALVGYIWSGTVSGSYVKGGTVTLRPNQALSNVTAGCLVSTASPGVIRDSWASCALTAEGSGSRSIHYAGGLIGYINQGDSRVIDSYATGRVRSSAGAGGLIGTARAGAQVQRSYATGDVTGNDVGGLLGDSGQASVTNSYATGAVTGSSNTGGLVGKMRGGRVADNYAIGNVAATGGNVGGLVGEISNGGNIVTSYASGDVSSSGNSNIGGLVGRATGAATRIDASYATSKVTASAGSSSIGGLVGYIDGHNLRITACYAAGQVSSSSAGYDNLGGLVGYVFLTGSQTNNYARITDCYTVSPLSSTGGGSDRLGGLQGHSGHVLHASLSHYTNTYWDTQATGQANSYNSRGSSGRTTSALQSPTEFAGGIYASWNQSHWDLGTGAQYPILKSQTAAGIAAQLGNSRPTDRRFAPAVDYDRDNDGLIEVGSLAQLDAIRHDLNGDGNSAAGTAGADGLAYLAAFPGLRSEYDNDDEDGLMGCPGGICHGYELVGDLDFASDSDYANWMPIGPYTGVFDGKGHPMSNLAINSTADYVGLFSIVEGSNALLAGVRLPDVKIAADSPHDVGALAGFLGHGAAVRTSYASGTVAASVAGSDEIHAGGLVGRAVNNDRIGMTTTPAAKDGAHIAASYSRVSVTVTTNDPAAAPHAGSGVGGLVGVIEGVPGRQAHITAAYGNGAVTANWVSDDPLPVGGLYGAATVTRVRASYWNVDTTGIADDADDDPPEGKTTSELRSPTRYAGIYETWNTYDLDGDGAADAPWDFGSGGQYPTLDPDEHEPNECPGPFCTTDQEYVAPPIVYNLNIRFSVKGLTLDEGESATYQVRMTQAPAGHPAKVSITSNNPDVVVSPTELTFSSANYSQWQTVSVSTLRDANNTDESAHLAHRGPNLSYGAIIVAVNDIWPGTHTETVNGHTVTMRHNLDAPAGVTVTAPATLDANTEVTIGAAPSDTPLSAPGYGLGATPAARLLASIRVDAAPSDGLTICLEAPAALVAEAGAHRLTLLRYANGGWSPVAGAARRDAADATGTGTATLCAAGVRQYGVFAAAYYMPDALGLAANLAAASGGPGRIVLTWTPAANATLHYVFGIKKSDAAARDFSNLAAWGFAERLNVHTVTGLESGATYHFTVIGGRARPNGSDEWGAWTPLLTATAE